MNATRLIMGMPVTIILGGDDKTVKNTVERTFEYFKYVDETFSYYKPESEISQINRGQHVISKASEDVRKIFDLAEKTKIETNGFFDIVNRDGKYDPSGIVKGWAIYNAASLIQNAGFSNYYVEAGGDIQVRGKNDSDEDWTIGIKNPFNQNENIKVVHLNDHGIATSGTYIRGQHIYDPHSKSKTFDDIISLTVIGSNIYDADRYATAAFAMGRAGVEFIERLDGFEAYMIDSKGIATMTSGFQRFI